MEKLTFLIKKKRRLEMIPYKSNNSSNRRLRPKERHSKNRWDIL